MSVKSWIVFETASGKLKAVEWEANVEDDIRQAGRKILGYPAAKTAEGAIDYVEDIL